MQPSGTKYQTIPTHDASLLSFLLLRYHAYRFCIIYGREGCLSVVLSDKSVSDSSSGLAGHDCSRAKRNVVIRIANQIIKLDRPIGEVDHVIFTRTVGLSRSKV